MSSGLRQRASEKGATAIFIAILATLLLSVAAMSVDLGNAWARKRGVQRQADVAALSAGYKLPATDGAAQLAVANLVAQSFNEPDNQVPGTTGTVTGAQLLDGNLKNGEVTFSTVGDTVGARMKVTAPHARVDFGLANVMGISGTNVQRSATVEVFGSLPPLVDTMPMWLPTGCAYGPGTADTSSQGQLDPNTTATPTGAYTPPENTQSGFTITSVSPEAANEGGSLSVTVTVAGLNNNQSTGSVRLAFDSATTGNATGVTWAQSGSNGTATITVNTNVTSVPGTWHVYALVDSGNSQKVTTNSLPFTVNPNATPTASPSPTPTAAQTSNCAFSEVGNFGQLDSPRADTNQLQERLAKNTAVGLDHYVVPWSPDAPPSSNNCGQNETQKIAGAVLDTSPVDGSNCVDVQSGNDGGGLTSGLLTGGTGYAGRLDATNGHTTCAGRSDMTVKGVLINNDILSCFLRNGATLDDIAQAGGADDVDQSWLDRSITDSPRFVWVPLVYAGDRGSHEFQALRGYVPAFITDETQTSPATAANGVTMNNGGQQVESVSIFSFNPNILPPNLRSPDQSYNEDAPSIVRLVD